MVGLRNIEYLTILIGLDRRGDSFHLSSSLLSSRPFLQSFGAYITISVREMDFYVHVGFFKFRQYEAVIKLKYENV